MNIENFHALTDDNLNEFLSTHYHIQSPYYGFAFLAYRNANPSKNIHSADKHKTEDQKEKEYPKFFQFGYWQTNKEFKINCKTKKDFYITSNLFQNAKKRTTKNVSTITNYVIDLDCRTRSRNIRKYIDFKIIAYWIDFFIKQMHDEDPLFPIPNTYVITGRGIQLWWAAKPFPYHQFNYVYKSTIEMLMDKVDELLSSASKKVQELRNIMGDDIQNIAINQYADIDYVQLLQQLTVDRAASKKTAGFFRMPGSFHTSIKSYGCFYVAHNERFDSVDWYFKTHESDTGIFIPRKKQKKCKKRNNTTVDLAIERNEMLTKLVEYRASRRILSKEYRDITCLILFAAYVSTGHTSEEAFDAVFSINRKFRYPMEEKEIISYMSTCIHKKYKFRNSTIKELLYITEEEAEYIGLFENHREYERNEKKKKKKYRNMYIYYLKDICTNQREIAAIVGCSQSTVHRVLSVDNPYSPDEMSLFIHDIQNQAIKKDIEKIESEIGDIKRFKYKSISAITPDEKKIIDSKMHDISIHYSTSPVLSSSSAFKEIQSLYKDFVSLYNIAHAFPFVSEEDAALIRHLPQGFSLADYIALKS